MVEKEIATNEYTDTRKLPFWNEIVCGESSELLKQIPDASVDLVITSPPYFKQRDYGAGLGNEQLPAEYLASLLPIFQECVRVVKTTGNIVFNLGDKYDDSSLLLMPYRFAIAATEQCGVRLVNNITWVKSNPTPRQFKRRLVSSTEPFFHFVKTDDYAYYLDEFLKDEAVKANGGNKASDKVGKSYFALIEKSELLSEQKHQARLALQQVIEEVKRGEIQGFRMKIRGLHSEPFGGQEGGRKIQMERNGFTIIRIYGHPMKRDVLTTPVESLKSCPHPAIYPTQVVEEFLRLLTKPNDIVLDPFVGSGSTAVAAYKTNRVYIGFDLNPDYCDYARSRIRNTTYQTSFLDE
ncbi:MAG: site-specific DNA-methyltransferase [Acidobacteria bacterium]|nr:site-specific DNA-methyltransferase [Acidobacteriota bacterium]